MFILLDVVFFIYSIIYLPYLIVTKRWHKDFIQRFGFFSTNLEVKIAAQSNVWIHAVSVGEVTAIEGFIRAFRKIRPDLSIILTVTTKTGYELAQRRFAGMATVIAAPLDFSGTVKAFTDMIKPRVYIAAETEIWPNLFERLYKNGVPIAIINGRISDRSYGRYQKIKFLLKPVLNQVSIFAMQSEKDRERIVSLGAPIQRVVNVGNIKFDGLLDFDKDIKKDLGFNPRLPRWLAGSTHPGEEKIILDVFKSVKQQYPQWQLMIAPRHIERSAEVLALVKDAGFTTTLFSQVMNMPSIASDVIVVDTIGHLRQLYSYAQLVFVGKSLCVGGGHNVIEPGMYGKAIVVGPLMANFTDILKSFKDNQAIVQVADKDEFKRVIVNLVADEARRNSLGLKAKETIFKNQGASKRTLDLIQTCL